MDDAAVGEVAGARAFDLSSSTLLSLPTMAFCFSSQSLFPPALETLHQPATYHHLHTVVDSTMALTPRRTLSRAAAWAHAVTAGSAWW